MPRKSGSANVYCTLREAFDLVGTAVCGTEWQGFEADCDPARVKQQTDTKSLLCKPAPDGRAFTKDRLPDPTRPIDGKDGAMLIQAAERYIKALAELLRLIHSGLLPTEFIPENETTERKTINASAWPDPAKFDPKNPTWGDLWFDIAADRVVRKSAEKPAASGYERNYGALAWAYTGMRGHVEINREKLEKALRLPEEGTANGDVLPTLDTVGAEGPQPKTHAEIAKLRNKLKEWLEKKACADEARQFTKAGFLDKAQEEVDQRITKNLFNEVWRSAEIPTDLRKPGVRPTRLR